MTTPPATVDLDVMVATLVRTSVVWMSDEVLGVPYSLLKGMLYPRPPYKRFLLTKRNGSPRTIDEPRQRLKIIQEKVLAYLTERASAPKPCVHGFTPKRSILTNAVKHCSPQTHHVLNLDLQDFFPSITFYRVRGVLMKKPFECSHHVATVLAHICTLDGALPQGAPTSPFLSNLICRSMDRDLMDLARRHRATYTRYADDLTFSFSARRPENLPANICSYDSGAVTLGGELQDLITGRHHFTINAAKTRMSTRISRMEVTGLTINEFPNVKRSFIDGIRGALHAWEKHGFEKAQNEWEKRIADTGALDYKKRWWKRQTMSKRVPRLSSVLWGKLLYVRMVRGADDLLYNRLAERYNAVRSVAAPRLPTDPVARDRTGAEKALFMVEWDAMHLGKPVGALGTAFAYKDIGLITCEHVIKHGNTGPYADAIKGADIHVVDVLTGKHWPVKIVHRDKNYDLAVLQFNVPEPPAHRHFLGADKPIARDETGWLIGFPDPSSGRKANQTRTEVTNVFARHGLQRFETREWIRKGNSGGPFVDENYRVVGVAQEGAEQGKGSNRCLTVAELDQWLAKWQTPATTPEAPTATPNAVITAILDSINPADAAPEPYQPVSVAAPVDAAGLQPAPAEPPKTPAKPAWPSKPL
jgi:hypothetical protein